MKTFAASLLIAALWLGSAACAVPGPASPWPSDEVRGRISTVETDGTIIVVPPTGKPVGFNVDPRTAVVERGGKPAAFTDLRQDDLVTVRLVGGVFQIVASPAQPQVSPKAP